MATTFLVIHPVNGEHLGQWYSSLESLGDIRILAADHALLKLDSALAGKERNIPVTNLNPGFNPADFQTSIECSSEKSSQALQKAAQACQASSRVIVEMGSHFSLDLINSLKGLEKRPTIIGYYENDASFVTKEYSSIASKVVSLCDEILFANKNLVKEGICDENKAYIDLSGKKLTGLGFYPFSEVDIIKTMRETKRDELRKELNIPLDAKCIVFLGGANQASYDAFHKFLNMLASCMDHDESLRDITIILQKHPRATAESELHLNLWPKSHTQFKGSTLVLKDNLNRTAAIADGVYYYQTTTAPKLALAGLSPYRIGLEDTPEDALTKLEPAANIVNEKFFSISLESPYNPINPDTLYDSLGADRAWEECLKNYLYIE